jgi:hypothetical protein
MATDASAGGDASSIVVDPGVDACASAQLAMDTHNCGACGHDCLGGACVGSVCQPFRVSETDASAVSIAADPVGVYWVAKNGTQVLACAPQGCSGAPTVLSGAFTSTVALVAVGSELAVLDQNDLQRVTTPAGAAAVLSLQLSAGTALCTDGTPYVYFQATSSAFPSVSRMLIDGGDPLPGAFVASNSLDTFGCGGGHVVWRTTLPADTIYACAEPADCGAPASIVPSNAGGEMHIAVTATEAFFTSRGAGTLSACPITGCASPTVLRTEPDLNGVAVDATYVYITSGNGGSVTRCDQSGCAASSKVLASNQTNPHALVVTQDAVYWATDADGTTGAAIWRIAK